MWTYLKNLAFLSVLLSSSFLGSDLLAAPSSSCSQILSQLGKSYSIDPQKNFEKNKILVPSHFFKFIEKNQSLNDSQKTQIISALKLVKIKPSYNKSLHTKTNVFGISSGKISSSNSNNLIGSGSLIAAFANGTVGPAPGSAVAAAALGFYSSRLQTEIERRQALGPTPALNAGGVQDYRPLEMNSVAEVELADFSQSHRLKVAEFKALRDLAERSGLRVMLMGGSAASLGFYMKWDLLRQKGDSRFVADRFEYDLDQILSALQDVDLLVMRADGKPESYEEMAKFKSAAAQLIPQRKVDVRALNIDFENRPALKTDSEFFIQHNDSLSMGLVELTQPGSGESLYRDLFEFVDGAPSRPKIIREIALGRIQYLYSEEHHQHSRTQQGKNPPIISVIRYLTKVFQFGLGMSLEDQRAIHRIIVEYNPKEAFSDPYIPYWLGNNAAKLLILAADLEEAWNALDELGLRNKLSYTEFEGAHLFEREPLRSRAHPKAYPLKQLSLSVPSSAALGILAHETDLIAAQSILRHPFGELNFFVSRDFVNGEAALLGDGVYFNAGRKGSGNGAKGYHIVVKPEASAVEGTDYVQTSGVLGKTVIIKDASKFRISSARIRPNLGTMLRELLEQPSNSVIDAGQIAKLQREMSARGGQAQEIIIETMIEFLKENGASGISKVLRFEAGIFSGNVTDVYALLKQKPFQLLSDLGWSKFREGLAKVRDEEGPSNLALRFEIENRLRVKARFGVSELELVTRGEKRPLDRLLLEWKMSQDQFIKIFAEEMMGQLDGDNLFGFSLSSGNLRAWVRGSSLEAQATALIDLVSDELANRTPHDPPLKRFKMR